MQTKNGPINLPAEEVLHIPGPGFDGVTGYSIVSFARNSLGLDLSAQEYGAKFFSRGGRVPYVLTHPGRFKNDQEFDEFRKKWEAEYEGSTGYGKVPILEGGLDYKQIGFKPEDTQLINTRKFSVEEICRWSLVYPFEVGDMSRANFSNIEQLTIDRIFHTLGYWFKVWEDQLWLRLLPERMKDTHFFEFERRAILMGDFETRMKGYHIALQDGFLNPDTVCALENLPKLPNGAGRAYHIQMNMQTLPGTGQPTAIELAALARAGAQQQRNETDANR
jgi:HK97 family phage portal protein